MNCSDGKRRYLGLNSYREPTVSIRPDGTFVNIQEPATFTYPDGLKGKARTDFTGAFAAKDKATGTVTSTFEARRVKRSSPPVRWTAHLDGTAGAPFRDEVMATGKYQVGGSGLRFSRFATLAPGRTVTDLKFKFRVPCKRGGWYGYPIDFVPIWLNRKAESAVDLRERGGYRLAGGARSSERYRLVVRFSKSVGVYRVTGRFTMRAVIRRRGKFVNSCSATRRFSGVFVNDGPANLF